MPYDPLSILALHVTMGQDENKPYGRTGVINHAPHNNNTKDEVMDKQVEAGSETLAGIQTFAARYPFPLDDFQLEAMVQLAQEQSVLVAAPTGTGKTLVAEYAIWLAQQRYQRVIYTTPLKALSNH